MYWLTAGKTLSPQHIPNLSSHMNWVRALRVAASPEQASSYASEGSSLPSLPPAPSQRIQGLHRWHWTHRFSECKDWKGPGNYLKPNSNSAGRCNIKKRKKKSKKNLHIRLSENLTTSLTESGRSLLGMTSSTWQACLIYPSQPACEVGR